jgi:ketosteroid isomerase-like protein
LEDDRIERLRRGYAAFNVGGLPAILDLLVADIEVSDRESVPDRSTHYGLDGIQGLFESTMEAFDELELEPEEFVEAGDRTIVVLRQRARGRGSGVQVEGQVVHVWTWRADRAVQLRIFGDKEKALEALGGEEPDA